MVYKFPPDIQTLIETHLASGRYSEADDVLRDALRALNEEDSDLTAVSEAIAEWQAGDEGVPLDQAFDELDRRIESQIHK